MPRYRPRVKAVVPRLAALPVLVVTLVGTGCLDLGGPPVTVMQGQLSTGPGVVFAERGVLWEGTFEHAATFGEDGRFEIPLPSGDLWGFHAYLEGYIYLPIQTNIGVGLPTTVTQRMVAWEQLCDRSGRCNWVEQSRIVTILTPEVDVDPTDNPVISNPTVVGRGNGLFQVSVEVHDPEGDLSNQILVHHMASGVAISLNPTMPIVDGNRPNGLFRGTVQIPVDGPQDGPWQFVAADHQCSNSHILVVEPE